MDENKTRIATQKALARFSEKYDLDENKISDLLGAAYRQKLKKRGLLIGGVIVFKFKTLPDNESTSNDDIANFIKDIIDGKITEDVLVCRTVAEYKAFAKFLALLPELRDDTLNNYKTYLSKYPAITDITLGIFERLYTESEELWKRGDITAAMLLSPAIRDYANCPVQIHCYTQKDGDVLITTEKYNWDGKEYRKMPKVEIKDVSVEFVDSEDDKNNVGCTIAMFVAIFIAIGYYLSKIL